VLNAPLKPYQSMLMEFRFLSMFLLIFRNTKKATSRRKQKF